MYYSSLQPFCSGKSLIVLHFPVKIQARDAHAFIRLLLQHNFLLPRPSKIAVSNLARPELADINPLPQHWLRILLCLLCHLFFIGIQPAHIRGIGRSTRRDAHRAHATSRICTHAHLPRRKTIVISHKCLLAIHVTRKPLALTHHFQRVILSPIKSIGQIRQHRPRLVFSPIEHKPIKSLHTKIIIPPQILIPHHNPRPGDNRMGIVITRLGIGVQLSHLRFHRVIPPQRLTRHQAPVRLGSVLQHLCVAIFHHPIVTQHIPLGGRNQRISPALEILLLDTLIRLCLIQHRPQRTSRQVNLRQQLFIVCHDFLPVKK